MTLSGVAQNADTVPLDTPGKRVLLAGNTNAIENGPWVVQNGAWTRPNGFRSGLRASGYQVWVTGGARGVDTEWVCDSPVGADVIDVNSLEFHSRGPEQNIRFLEWGRDDWFLGSPTAPGWIFNFNGGASARMITQTGASEQIGLVQVIGGGTAGSEATGTKYVITGGQPSGGAFSLSADDELWCGILFDISTPSNLTNQFLSRWGFGNVRAGDPTNGMYFFNDHAVSNLIGFTSVAGGIATTLATTVVFTPGLGPFGEIRMSAADPGVLYVYVNGVFQFKVSTNVPLGVPIGPFVQVRRIAGATGTTQVDLHKGTIRFAAQRAEVA
jgi:hypothetical protein